MPVDILCELEIPRPRAEVAAYAADPDNTTSSTVSGATSTDVLAG